MTPKETEVEPPAPAIGEVTPRFSSAASTVVAFSAAAVAVALALLSLRWPLFHDLPIFLYDGFLMHDLGWVPYRDFFEINPPGTMLLYELVHRLSDGDSFALRLIDMVVLAGMSSFTILALRDHGWRSGVLASACFAIAYLAEGPAQSLQREYVCVMLLAVSLWMAFHVSDSSRTWLPMSSMGLLAGVAACIKPPIVLLWAPLVLTAMATRIKSLNVGPGAAVSEVSRLLIPFALGALLPFAAIVGMLWRNEALGEYLAIMGEYYPLYAQLNGGGAPWEGEGLGFFFRRYVFGTLRLGLDFRFLLLAAVGFVLAWTCRRRAGVVQSVAICGIVLAGLAYAAVGGKFWIYHGFPLHYGLALLAGLTVSRELLGQLRGSTTRIAVPFVALVAVAVALPVTMMREEYRHWRDGSEFDVKDGRVTLVAEYLQENTRPDEPVMVLDVTSGALHALYRIRRPLHGRFIYDFHVYHHQESPYVQKLRREMLDQFSDGEPEIVVRMDDTWTRSPDSGITDFPQLAALLEREYEAVLQENDVSILRRRR